MNHLASDCFYIASHQSTTALTMTNLMQSRFSNVQLEILQLFTEDLSEDDLLKIKDLLSAYRFSRATEAASKAVEIQGWTSEDFQRLLRTNMRTPHKANQVVTNPEA
jgi:hypothetical protein